MIEYRPPRRRSLPGDERRAEPADPRAGPEKKKAGGFPPARDP